MPSWSTRPPSALSEAIQTLQDDLINAPDKATKTKIKKTIIQATLLIIRPIIEEFKKHRKKIVLINYDPLFKVLTISYPHFNMGDNDDNTEVEQFKIEFIGLCKSIGIYGSVITIYIVFHKAQDNNAFKTQANYIEENISNSNMVTEVVDRLYELSNTLKQPLFTSAENHTAASEIIPDMSKFIYLEIIKTEPRYKDNDDFNSPKSNKRLQLANYGDNLMFF